MALLLTEEIFVRMSESGINEMNVRIRRFFGEVSLVMTGVGAENNPFSALSEWDSESEDSYRDMIFRSYQSLLGYSRHGNRNIVTIRVHETDSKAAWLTMVFMLLGIIFGFVMKIMPESVSSFIGDNILNVIQTLFMNALKMLVAPLIFLSVSSSLAKLSGDSNLGRIGIKTILSFTVTSLISLMIGIMLAMTVFGGDRLPLMPENITGSSINVSGSNISVTEIIMDIIPKNLVSPIMNGNMIQLLFVAIIFGIALGGLSDRTANLRLILGEMNNLFIRLINMVIKCMPVIAFSAMALLIFGSSASTLRALMVLLLTLFGGCLLIFIMNVIIVGVFGKVSPWIFIRKILPHQLQCFIIGGSSATIPTSLTLCSTKLGISDRIASFVVPLGSTVNMNGTCMGIALTSIMLSKLSGLDISVELLLRIGCLSFFLAIGMPGIHNGSLICITMVVGAVGASVELVGVIVGIWEIVTRML